MSTFDNNRLSKFVFMVMLLMLIFKFMFMVCLHVLELLELLLGMTRIVA